MYVFEGELFRFDKLLYELSNNISAEVVKQSVYKSIDALQDYIHKNRKLIDNEFKTIYQNKTTNQQVP